MFILSDGVSMNFFRSFMTLSFLSALTGCVSSSSVEGVVMSSREVGQGVTEHLVQTNRADLPFYILKVNNNKFHQESKVVLEIPPDSMIQGRY
jgi:hypothetical protein